MRPPYKPEGYPSVSVYLVVEGARDLIAFLEATFGATPARRYEGPDGSLLHAEMRIDDTIVMIGDAGGVWKPLTNWLHVYVKDVDETYQRALRAGAVSVQAPLQKEGDPDKRGGVKDPWGNTWWIATQAG